MDIVVNDLTNELIFIPDVTAYVIHSTIAEAVRNYKNWLLFISDVNAYPIIYSIRYTYVISVNIAIYAYLILNQQPIISMYMMSHKYANVNLSDPHILLKLSF